MQCFHPFAQNLWPQIPHWTAIFWITIMSIFTDNPHSHDVLSNFQEPSIWNVPNHQLKSANFNDIYQPLLLSSLTTIPSLPSTSCHLRWSTLYLLRKIRHHVMYIQQPQIDSTTCNKIDSATYTDSLLWDTKHYTINIATRNVQIAYDP